jgi:hypothetical protein
MRQFVENGDNSWLQDLAEFLGYTQIPPGAKQVKEFLFWIWTGVAGLCVVVLPLALWRFCVSMRRGVAV